jgi:hypothetical protein
VSPISKRAGRGIWRGVYSSMTSHPDYQVLSPHARLVLLTLRLGGQSTIAGLGRVYMEPLLAETGLSLRHVKAALLELEQTPSPERPWIVRDGPLVWIRNALKFDPTVTVNNPNHLSSVERAVAALPRSSPAVQRFRDYYRLPDQGEETPVASDGVSHEGTHAGTDGVSHDASGLGSRNRTPNRNRTPKRIPSADESLSVGSNPGLQRRNNGEPEAITETLKAMGQRLGFVETE